MLISSDGYVSFQIEALQLDDRRLDDLRTASKSSYSYQSMSTAIQSRYRARHFMPLPTTFT